MGMKHLLPSLPCAAIVVVGPETMWAFPHPEPRVGGEGSSSPLDFASVTIPRCFPLAGPASLGYKNLF